MTRPSERDQQILRGLARRIDGDDPVAHVRLGVLYHRKGMLEEGLAQLRLALELDAYQADALVALGRLLADAGRPDDARHAYERALRVRADHEGARAGLRALDGGPADLRLSA